MNIAIPLGGQIRMVICSSFVIAKRKDAMHYDLSGESFQLTSVTSEQVYVFDDSVPTCRLLNKPYDKESAQHYVIDGFIISPNVELVSVGTVDAGFEFSDHNPVLMEIVLK